MFFQRFFDDIIVGALNVKTEPCGQCPASLQFTCNVIRMPMWIFWIFLTSGYNRMRILKYDDNKQCQFSRGQLREEASV